MATNVRLYNPNFTGVCPAAEDAPPAEFEPQQQEHIAAIEAQIADLEAELAQLYLAEEDIYQPREAVDEAESNDQVYQRGEAVGEGDYDAQEEAHIASMEAQIAHLEAALTALYRTEVQQGTVRELDNHPDMEAYIADIAAQLKLNVTEPAAFDAAIKLARIIIQLKTTGASEERVVIIPGSKVITGDEISVVVEGGSARGEEIRLVVAGEKKKGGASLIAVAAVVTGGVLGGIIGSVVGVASLGAAIAAVTTAIGLQKKKRDTEELGSLMSTLSYTPENAGAQAKDVIHYLDSCYDKLAVVAK